MFVKQLSVFIENREGRLEQVTEVLKEQDINILSLSMADTTEYGMLRMIVSDPDKAKAALREKGFSAMLTDVLAYYGITSGKGNIRGCMGPRNAVATGLLYAYLQEEGIHE